MALSHHIPQPGQEVILLELLGYLSHTLEEGHFLWQPLSCLRGLHQHGGILERLLSLSNFKQAPQWRPVFVWD